MKLYELTVELATLWETASEVLDVGNTDDAERNHALAFLEEKLKAIEGTHAEKCLNIACLVKNSEAEAQAIADEEARLKARRQSLERKADWLRTYLQNNMEPGTNLKDPRAVIGWRKSSAVEITVKPEELPTEFQRTKLTVDADKTALKAHLETGATVPGATLVQRFNLQIK